MSGILLATVGNSYGSAPVNTVAPAVTGTATFGSTLTTTNGTWLGAPAPTFTYQWYRSPSTSISGAIVVPNATFAAGDAVVIFNNTSGAITLTMSITTAYIGGTDADKATISLATRGICNVLFISGTVCVVTGNVT